MFPALAKDFLDGIKLSLHSLLGKDIIPKFFIEGVGTASEDTVILAAEKLLLQEEVDLTIAFCSIFRLKELTALFNAYKKPLIHLDLGGRILKKEHISPYIVHHSLHLWQSAYAAGGHAVKAYGKKVAVVGSFYDSGYQLTESFVKGLEEHGGNVGSYWIGPMDYQSESYETMIREIMRINPDFIFALFSHKEAIKVFEALSQSELNGKTPILVTPLMTDEKMNSQNYQLENVISVGTWSFDDENHLMTQFILSFVEEYGEKPNIISLLGYETGQLIATTIHSDGTLPKRIGETIPREILETPRGKIQFNTYNESYLNTFKIRQFNFNEFRYHNTVIGTINFSSASTLNEKFEESPYTGWQNPYICT